MTVLKAVVILLILQPGTAYRGYKSSINYHHRKRRVHVLGHYRTFSNTTSLLPVYSYYGIPYASVGGGHMQFMPPSSRKWRHRKSYLRKGHGCVQKDIDWTKYVLQVPKHVAQKMYAVVSEIPEKSSECLNLITHVPIKGKSIFKVKIKISFSV